MVRKKMTAYFMPPKQKDTEILGRCPVKVEKVNREQFGFFPLRAIECRRSYESYTGGKVKHEYADCKFHWEDEPVKVTTLFNPVNWRSSHLVTDPMKWLNGATPHFQWNCSSKIFVTGQQRHTRRK